MTGALFFRDAHGVEHAASGVVTGFDLGAPEGDQTAVAIRSLAGGVRTLSFTATARVDRVSMVRFFRAMGLPGAPIYRIKRGRWRR